MSKKTYALALILPDKVINVPEFTTNSYSEAYTKAIEEIQLHDKAFAVLIYSETSAMVLNRTRLQKYFKPPKDGTDIQTP